MCSPGEPVGWLFMGKDLDAGWGKGCFVVVEVAIDLGPSRELGVDAGTTHEVEGEQTLGHEVTPQV